ncbi:MAG: fibrobacter succinogenes major paralogous domain-containing protein, partial [Saprospiraceae bacterium]|nr:fibrobacter succinogenes major paralogous domain-containing protein [Saprospiraceae bacterium]
GFTALPGGLRYETGIFSFINDFSHFWSATAKSDDPVKAWDRSMYSQANSVFGNNNNKPAGMYIRCLKD